MLASSPRTLGAWRWSATGSGRWTPTATPTSTPSSTSDSGLNSTRFRKGELALHKAAAARDREAEHKGDRTSDHGGLGCGFDHVGQDNHGKLRGSKEWVPLTKLGQLVKTGMLCKVEEAYLHSLLIKEHQVLETLVPGHTAAHRELLEEHRELEVDQRRGGSRSAAAVGLR